MPGGFPDDVNPLFSKPSKRKNEEAARLPALKVEYVSPEWKSWMKDHSSSSRPDFPIEYVLVPIKFGSPS